LQTAKALKLSLEADPYDVNIWTDGIFTPGLTNIEALEQELSEADFAILLLSPNDRVFSRLKFFSAPRDNLILELGLFIGAIGRTRALMVQPQGRKLFRQTFWVLPPSNIRRPIWIL
jgi:CRP/FNR family cyclic AMP-dependent transcriptional regulator